MKTSGFLAYAALVVFLGGLVLPTTAKPTAKSAAKVRTGEEVFKQFCANCHLGGGNRVKENHPVAGSKQLSTLAAFKSYLSAPPGHMPYYQSIVKDDKTLQLLYDYCKKLPEPPINSASANVGRDEIY